MSKPEATLTVRDGALGVIPASDNVFACVGVTSAGTANTPALYSDPADIVSAFGTGPAVEAAAYALVAGGGGVCLFCKAATTTAGVAGAVTKVGTGLCVVTTSGTPLDAYSVIVTITRGGTNPAAGTAAMRVSLDGGETTGPEVSVPVSGSYVITGTGLTLAFSAASLVAGDTYSFACTQPVADAASIAAALDAIAAGPQTFKFVHVVGQTTGATDADAATAAATLVGTVGAKVAAWEAAFRYSHAILDGAQVANTAGGDSALVTAFASVAVANGRASVAAGRASLVSPVTGRVVLRPVGWIASAKRVAAPLQEDSARVRSGPLPGVVGIERDENAREGLDSARFITARTFTGRPGYYLTNHPTMSAPGSDFTYVQNREVMNRACEVARNAMVEELSDSIRITPTGATPPPGSPGAPGTIDERDARAIETRATRALENALVNPGHAQSAVLVINRTNYPLSDNRILYKVRVLPFGYPKAIEGEAAFTNPALEV